MSQTNNLGSAIADQFQRMLENVKLSPQESEIVGRASTLLAAVALDTPGAEEFDQQDLAIRRDAALAMIQNIGVAHAIRANEMMRQAVMGVFVKALQVGLGLVTAAS